MRRAGAVLAAALVLTAAAGGQPVPPGATTVPHWKAWLCFPGSPNDWCSVDLTTDVFTASGKHTTVHVSVPRDPPIDCFYVYPTVSEEHRGNADLRIQAAEKETAIVQAARFSHVCRVYAPLYRQVTAYGDDNPYHGDPKLAAADVLAAWNDYLAHWNHGRGVVLIGHSQGKDVLDGLISSQIERNPAERKLLVSAILLGGGVAVRQGSTSGGTFKSLPACTSAVETGCIVAFASWDRTPPSGAHGQFVPSPADRILCVDPASPGSDATVPITPIFAGINPELIVPDTSRYAAYHWVEFPGLYSARCVSSGSKAWLLVSRIRRLGDSRPTVQEALGPLHGLHAADVNIALANLVDLVGSEARSWRAHR